MPQSEPPTALDLLPDLTGKEALLLARMLTRLADEIWRTYGDDIGLVLAEEHGLAHDYLGDPDVPFADDEDPPF